jgi:signal transduction histidine kinase
MILPVRTERFGIADAPLTDVVREVEAVARIGAAQILLRAVCETTGMGFAAIVCSMPSGSWVCAVEDRMQLGLQSGERFDLKTLDGRDAPVLSMHSDAAATPDVANHGGFQLTRGDSMAEVFGAYVSVPIMFDNGRHFGRLCALDPRSRADHQPWARPMFERFAQLIALELGTIVSREREHMALLDERATGELREQFIAILGHDLRNPLQAVSANGEILERRLNDSNKALASRIVTNARRMSALIDDVMDFARGRLGGGMNVELKETDGLDGALLAAVRELQDARPDRLITADISINRTIQCDVGRLQQVVSNLLANALTHGSQHTPVRFTARADNTYLVLEVWNDGDVIPRDSIGKVFAPFWRHSIANHREGLGLGLHICAQIVRAHHGHITVTSEPDTGTQFTARLPLSVVPGHVSAYAHTP